MRPLATIVIALAAAAAPARARADVTDAKPAPLVGATETARVAIAKGFIDDAIGFDGALLAFVNTDGATFSELVVYDVAKKAEAERVALPAELGATIDVRILDRADRPRVLVIGRGDDGKARAVVISGDGKIARSVGPADDITFYPRIAPSVALHRARATAHGGVTHELEVVELDKGKRVGKLHTLELDGAGKDAKLDFTLAYFTDGFTLAFGTQGGHWDPKENQRTPDVAATYDLARGGVTTGTIKDPMARQRNLQVMTARPAGAPGVFARMSQDLMGVEVWSWIDGTPVELDQPIAQYDPASLTLIGAPIGGPSFLMLEVDPTNAAAVKRKKADPPYLDLFAIDGKTGKAARKARVLATPKKHYATGVSGGTWWLLERSVGYDRGGTSLVVYAIAN